MKFFLAFLLFPLTANAQTTAFEQFSSAFHQATVTDLHVGELTKQGLWRGQCATAQYPNRVRSSAVTFEVLTDPVMGDDIVFIEQINIRQETTDEHFYRLITSIRRAGGKFFAPIRAGSDYFVAQRFQHFNRIYNEDVHKKEFYLRPDGDILRVFIHESDRSGTFVSVACEMDRFIPMQLVSN